MTSRSGRTGSDPIGRTIAVPPNVYRSPRLAARYAYSRPPVHPQKEMEVALPMTLESYHSYAMSESGVEVALTNGVSEAAVSEWCHQTLAAVFGHESKDVLFDAYVAYLRLVSR